MRPVLDDGCGEGSRVNGRVDKVYTTACTVHPIHNL